MTLSELLEKLKAVDPRTYVEIAISFAWAEIQLDELYPEYEGDKPHLPVDITINEHESDLIQGCLQRACERRGWTWCIYKQTPKEEKSHYAEISKIGPGYDGDYYNQYHESCITWKEANSPAEALLGAYIAAIKIKQSASKKQHKKCGNFYMDTTIDSSKTEGNKINEPIY